MSALKREHHKSKLSCSVPLCITSRWLQVFPPVPSSLCSQPTRVVQGHLQELQQLHQRCISYVVISMAAEGRKTREIAGLTIEGKRFGVFCQAHLIWKQTTGNQYGARKKISFFFP